MAKEIKNLLVNYLIDASLCQYVKKYLHGELVDIGCGEKPYEKILKKYTIPHSVSVVVAEIDPKLTGNEKSIPVARDILKLPHIEVGSHGYAHPFDWKVKKTKTKDGYNAIPQMHDIHKYKDIDFRKEIE